MTRAETWRTLLVDGFFFLLAAGLGLLAIVVPPLILPGIEPYDAPLFPLVKTGVEGFSLLSMVMLVGAGAILGYLRPRGAIVWGAATMVVLPPLAVIEMMADPTSHNLWPLEFFFYGMGTLPGIAGAVFGARYGRRPG